MTNDVLAILGALGGGVVFVGAVVTVVKAIFNQTAATQANTKALEKVTEVIDKHETRLSRLEGLNGLPR